MAGGIPLLPGYVFSATQQYRNFIRLNAADRTYEIETLLERLGDMKPELTGV